MIIVPHVARDSDGHVVVHDVFWTDSGIHVILSPSSNHAMEAATVTVQYQDRHLDLSRKIQGENRDVVFDVRVFAARHLPDHPVPLLVEYRLQHTAVEMTAVVTRERPAARTGVGASTLFSSDFNVFPLWYDYHTKQGIRHFYMYYHGVVTPTIQNVVLRGRPDVTLVQWDSSYRQASRCAARFTHKAQASQLQHSLHRFGIPNHTHMAYMDLDEFLAPDQGRTILQTVDDDCQKHCVIGFRCHWAATFGKLLPPTLPHTFLAAGQDLAYGHRSKNIVNTQRVESVDIHRPPGRHHRSTVVAGTMYHFWCWSGRRQPCKALTTMPLTNPAYAGQTVKFYHTIAHAFLGWNASTSTLDLACKSRGGACQWLLEHSNGCYRLRHVASGLYVSGLSATADLTRASRMQLVPYPQHTNHYALYDASRKAFLRFYDGSLGTQSSPLHKFSRAWPCEDFTITHA